MNSLIDFLNGLGTAWGGHALGMGWQVGVLIVGVACLDRLLVSRVRAVVRHALWLLVPIKLLLPPALSLPTSPAYWVPLRPEVDSGSHPGQLSRVDLLTEGALAELEGLEAASNGKAPASPRRLSVAGVLFGIWGIGVLGFGGVLAARGIRLRRAIRSADSAGPELVAALDWARERLGLRRGADIVLIRELSSPAVCGLLRPVLLLPSRLARTLTTGQLREVLLHELAHVKRGDLWVCHGMGLLQGLYWWHPLVWFAQARMRRVAEEATDETVVVALGGEVESYASTLVQVGRMVLRGAGMRLGLLGILEPESALAGRVRRMLTGNVATSVRLGWGTWAVLAGMALVLLPMSGPAQGDSPTPPPVPAPASAPPARSAVATVEAAATSGVSGTAASASATTSPSPSPQVASPSLAAEPVRTEAQRKQDEFRARLQGIRLPQVEFTNTPLREVVRWLSAESERRSSGGEPVNFLINRISLVDGSVTDGRTPAGVPAIDPDTGKPVSASTNVPPDTGEVLIRIQPALRDVTLYDVLRAVTESASVPLGYSLEDLGVVFFQGTPLRLVTRVFRVGVPLFERALREAMGQTSATTNAQDVLREWVARLGLSLQPPRAFYLNASKGLLMARLAVDEIEVLEKAIELMSAVPEQVVLETRVLEMSESRLRSLRLEKAVFAPREDGSNGAVVVPEDRLTEILRECGGDAQCWVLAAPRVTTLSHRGAVITRSSDPNPRDVKETIPFSIQVLPIVTSGAPVIELEMEASLGGLATEKGAPTNAPSVSARLSLRDGESMALVAERGSVRGVAGTAAPDPDRRFLLLITPTIIDPAGNPVYSKAPVPGR